MNTNKQQKQEVQCDYFKVSSRAPGSLCSSLYAGTINDMYFSAGSRICGQVTYSKTAIQSNNYALKLQEQEKYVTVLKFRQFKLTHLKFL